MEGGGAQKDKQNTARVIKSSLKKGKNKVKYGVLEVDFNHIRSFFTSQIYFLSKYGSKLILGAKKEILNSQTIGQKGGQK